MTQPDTERSIERLIKLAGERDMPSPEGVERARQAAYESWNRAVGQQAGRRNLLKPLLGFALAAGLAAVALFAWHGRPAPMAPERVARIATLSGGATLHETRGGAPVRVEQPVHSGATLETGEGRVALTFGDSLSLRMDRNTRLRFDDRGQVTLLAGSLYVDSGGLNAVQVLRIDTPAGVVRHVGTQFQVRVTRDTTSVRVREGRVLLTRSAGSTTDIATGDELTVTDDELTWRHGLPSFGADWEWSATVASPLEIENRPLAEFLAWMAREHGWQIRYGDETLQQRTRDIRLHGSLAGLGTDAMLERVSLVTGVAMSAHDGVLWVGGRQ
jgi:ferric-dicitrate binding protein FerR (iron transport regulator)